MKHFIFLIFVVASAFAQQSAVSNQQSAKAQETARADSLQRLNDKGYEPSELQKLKLENAQLKLVVVALQIQPLEQKRQEQLAVLSQLCEAVVKENHWPDNVKCDPATLKFKESQPGPEHDTRPVGINQPESSPASRDRSTALETKSDRQPVPARPALSTDPRQ